MRHGKDEKLVLIHDVHETVGKADKEFRPHTKIDDRRYLGILLDGARC